MTQIDVKNDSTFATESVPISVYDATTDCVFSYTEDGYHSRIYLRNDLVKTMFECDLIRITANMINNKEEQDVFCPCSLTCNGFMTESSKMLGLLRLKLAPIYLQNRRTWLTHIHHGLMRSYPDVLAGLTNENDLTINDIDTVLSRIGLDFKGHILYPTTPSYII